MHDLLSESRVGLSNNFSPLLLYCEDELSSCDPGRTSLPRHEGSWITWSVWRIQAHARIILLVSNVARLAVPRLSI
jgi:hypothetical protein